MSLRKKNNFSQGPLSHLCTIFASDVIPAPALACRVVAVGAQGSTQVTITAAAAVRVVCTQAIEARLGEEYKIQGITAVRSHSCRFLRA